MVSQSQLLSNNTQPLLPKGCEFTFVPRSNNEGVYKDGFFTYSKSYPDKKITVISPKNIGGLPFGGLPRIIMNYVATYAITHQTRKIYMGSSVSDFMRKLGITQVVRNLRGWERVLMQCNRLFTCSIKVDTKNDQSVEFTIYDPEQPWFEHTRHFGFWKDHLMISEDFYQIALSDFVPVDLDVLKRLSEQTFACEIYFYSNHKISTEGKHIHCTWKELQEAFSYRFLKETEFKEQFVKNINAVLSVWKGFFFRLTNTGVIIEQNNLETA